MPKESKTVLFIVEGPSDKSALEKIFKAIYKRNKTIEFLNTYIANGVPNSLLGSWRYIKEDLHSLERHTNLHIYFSRHPKPDGLL